MWREGACLQRSPLWLPNEADFADHGVTDLQGEVETCVQLLADLKIRADLANKLRMFYEMLNILEHRPEVPVTFFVISNCFGSSTRSQRTYIAIQR
jgi:hypothetical protein